MKIDLAGDHMRITESADGTLTITFDDKGTGRRCSDCSLCCRLLPVPPISKSAGQRCKHQKVGKGCAIYSTRPMACRTWSCRWLADPETAGLPRPDRAHYVIDIEYDSIAHIGEDGTTLGSRQVLQVWVDPAYRHAHHDPKLRAYLSRLAEEHGTAAIIRYSSREAVVLIAPCLNNTGKWVTVPGTIAARNELEQMILSAAPP